ncbi:cell division protein DivIB [Sporosarcina sp. P12(2017)]|uniref:cell division protein FtsQ/DivIB n=1 Tax=unclassified Sporosarcina TaxID=2647733 RepID=UPI000C16545D|nr:MULTISPECIES: FtsQ-type POTRA domain-containing protein [unclassified Sporosarcina]PIC58867.1 cell division protein DivIB [Sporosarcina sp. P10]PIC62187.1 cell division protein DivIB [Sporosarcina sp. P12(2017)]
MEKVIDIEDRIPSMRKKRRRRANMSFLLLVVIFVLVLLALLYFQSSLSDVSKISINETVLQESEYYKGQSGLYKGQSLWGFRAKDIENNLEKIPGVKEAKVKRDFYNDVSINVTEWEPVAYIENQTQYDLLLENGDRLEATDPDILSHAPILSGFTEPDVTERMIKQLQKMDNTVFELLSELRYEGEDKIDVFMSDGYEVHALILGFADKMSYYPDIIAQLPKEEKGVLDIEIGVYFKTYTDFYKEPVPVDVKIPQPVEESNVTKGKPAEVEINKEEKSEQETE